MAPEEVVGVYAFARPFRGAPLLAGLPSVARSVQRLYVLDGEWAVVDGRPRVVRGQAYPEGASTPLVLTYHADPDLLRAFPTVDVDRIGHAIGDRVADLRDRGLPIAGVQIDFDLGSRGLERLPGLLRLLRERLPAGSLLSVTALASHADAPIWREIAREADEICPMLYGYDPTRPTAKLDVARSRRFLADLEGVGAPILPVLGIATTPLEPELLRFAGSVDVDGFLLFDLRSWNRSPREDPP